MTRGLLRRLGCDARPLLGLALWALAGVSAAAFWEGGLPTTAAAAAPDYAVSIQPIFNRRCIACHGCLGSPCNVKLDSFRGVDRGGFGHNPYATHFGDYPRTDMDAADSTEAWRQRGFYPITALQAQLEQHPTIGMPFGLPAISEADFKTLKSWVAAGSPGPNASARQQAHTEANPEAVAAWEAFFNADDPRTRLVSRFIFQHLFLATIVLTDSPGDQFRLVRSSTPPARIVEDAEGHKRIETPPVEVIGTGPTGRATYGSSIPRSSSTSCARASKTIFCCYCPRNIASPCATAGPAASAS